MDSSFPLPVFNIESEEEDDHQVHEVPDIKNPKCDHLHRLLSDRSLSLTTHNQNAILKKLEGVAEDNLLKKNLKETCCSLPGNPRSTFLMVFSPDGSKVASSHGDHNINVTDLRTNKCISTLTGHPRTPWCIAFHPHRNDILASGCLGGQVRVWDLHGGSEMWSVTASEVTSVIASLSFHPSERLLVIATNSTLYFWDWNLPQPFAKCSTANEKQKLRYVSFDPLGNWLLTGISNTPGSSAYFAPSVATAPSSGSGPTTLAPVQISAGIPAHYRVERNNEQERERSLQNRYQTLLDQYERLRVRYQELRHRAAELELNANSSQNVGVYSDSHAEPSTSRGSPAVEASLLNTSSSDRFWRTLMNAAENLRALSNIGRSLNSPSQSMPSGEASSRSSSGPSLDQDARMRIQLLSRHIENMQRICRSHLEMTRHRRQVYRLQQIRRILEDLREQIRYLQVCVRDSLDRVSRLRTTPTSPSPGTSTSDGRSPPTTGRPSQPASVEPASLDIDLQLNLRRRLTQLQSRALIHQCSRRYRSAQLINRPRRVGDQSHIEHARLGRHLVNGRDGRNPIRSRFSLRRSGSHSPPINPVEQIDPHPGPSRDDSMNLVEDWYDDEPILEQRLTASRDQGSPTGWRRYRFSRPTSRVGSSTTVRSNRLLNVRSRSIHRRKPSLLSRIFQGRHLQHQMRMAINYSPLDAGPSGASQSIPPVHHETGGQRSADQSLRPLMERLESHFRLQRQTMGILAQLNEASVANDGTLDVGTLAGSSNPIPSEPSSSTDPGRSATASHGGDAGGSARPWASNVLHSIRHWRARRDAFERTRSLDSRSSTGSASTTDRFQAPRRIDSSYNLGGSGSRYRTFRTMDDDDSSDTDTDLTADSMSAALNWRQSNPIRSPRGVEQRMRLLWSEYLLQIGETGAPSSQAGIEGDANADQERIRYRMWLSTMVESLTSFFSQHGIHSSEPESSSASSAPTSAPPPQPSTPQSPPLQSRSAQPVPTFPYVTTPPRRFFPRVGHAGALIGSGANLGGSSVVGNFAAGSIGGGLAGAGIDSFGGPGQQRWNLRRNAESQVSLSTHLTYRIQAWDFCAKDGFIPDIQDPHANIVVPESKIHNDASVDVSADGRFLVTLVPCTSLTGALISLHSLEPSRLGLCLAQVNVDQFVVSVSISPTCRHLLLGLASSRALSVASRDHALPTLWAQVYQIPPKVFQALRGDARSTSGNESTDQGRLEKKCVPQGMLLHVRDLNQTADVGMTSLNCIRWIPTAGQGFVLGTNKGHLKVIN